MSVKIRKSNENETIADYYDVFDKTAFRFALLKKVLCECTNAVIIIDTNQRIAEHSADSVLEGIYHAGITPTVIRIKANPETFLGFRIKNNNKQREKLIVFTVESCFMTPDLFDSLSCCDIAVGIGPKRGLPDICDELRMDGIVTHKDNFEKSIYDSVLCCRISCTFNARTYIKEVINEMGL